MATEELKQVWNSADVVAVTVTILKQRQRKFCTRYSEYCDLQFSNLEDTRPRLLFTLIFNYKRSTHHKKRGPSITTERKIRKKQRRRLKRRTQVCTNNNICRIFGIQLFSFNSCSSSLFFGWKYVLDGWNFAVCFSFTSYELNLIVVEWQII